MTTANGAKGYRWERAIVVFLRALGIRAVRARQEGRWDVGDLHGLSPWVGQAKDWKTVTDACREGVAGALEQAARAGEPFGVAFVKRRQKGAAQGYAVTTVETWARALLRLRSAEDALARLDHDAYQAHLATYDRTPDA